MASPVDIRPDHLKIVQDILREYLPVDVRVWVFGSRAIWTTKDSSDLDLALESEGSLSHKLLGALKDAFEDSALPYTVDIVDLSRISESFRDIVMSQRAPLFMDGDRPIDISASQRKTILVLLEKYLPNTTAWVYGSRVKWTSPLQSDLDLVVFPTPEQHRKVSDLREAFEESNLPFRVDLFVWDEAPEQFRKQIEADHVVLLEREIRDMEEEWRETSLGEVIELKRGYDLPQYKRVPGPVPLVSSSGVSDYHQEAKVKGPGVVTGRYGTLGQVYFVPDDFWPLNTTLYVRQFKGNDPRFISYLLRELNFFAYSDKAAVPGLNRNHLHQATICYPINVRKQRAIAHILGTLDDKIELNRRMNETLEAMARALFKSWFVDFEPVRAKMEGRDTGLPPDVADLFPDKLVDSELGKVPEGWMVKALGDVVKVVGGATPSTKVIEYWHGGTHCWATPKDLSNLSSPVLLDTARKITNAGLKKISSGLLPPGTVLLSSRAPIGYLAISEEPVAINQGFIAIPPGDGISNLFMLYWCNAFREQILNYASGTTFLEISKRNFRQIPISISDEAVMDVFDKQAWPLHRSIAANEGESHLLTALRDALLPRLVSGKLRMVNFH